MLAHAALFLVLSHSCAADSSAAAAQSELKSIPSVTYVDSLGRQQDLADHIRAAVSQLGPLDGGQVKLLDDAIEVAFLAHKEDYRKFGEPQGMPYLRHIVGTVSTLVNEFGVRDPQAVAVMFLHDVQEDHPDVWEKEGARFGADVRAGVDLLTKQGDFEDYIRLLEQNGSRENLLQKLSDRINNLRGIRYAMEADSPADSRAELLAFTRKKFEETAAFLLPMAERSLKLTNADRRVFYRAVLAEIQRIRRAEPDAGFLDGLAQKLAVRYLGPESL